MSKLNARDVEAFRRLSFELMKQLAAVVWEALRQIDSKKDPLRELARVLKASAPAAAAASTALGVVGGGATGAALWVSSLGAFQGLLYTLGFLAVPLWAPIAGGVAGGAAVGGAVFALMSRLKKSELVKLTKLTAEALTVMSRVRGVVSVQAARLIDVVREQLVANGVATDVVNAAFTAAPKDIDALTATPGSFDEEQLREVLIQSWQCVLLSAVPNDVEVATFERLAARLGLVAEAEILREEAARRTSDGADRVVATIDIARHIIPTPSLDDAKNALEALMALDFSGTAKLRRQEVLSVAIDAATALSTLAAVSVRTHEALPVIGQAYGFARAALVGDENSLKKLKSTAVGLATRAGVEVSTAKGFFEQLEVPYVEQEAAAEKTVRREAKKKAGNS